MIFSLEVLQANFGDCLILHFGDDTNHKLMLIDGGPAGVYRKYLKPRLLELKDQLSPQKSLPISMVMVSHMDDDHVNGIVALTDDVLQEEGDGKVSPFQLNHFWFNTFDDIINNLQIPEISSIAATDTIASVNSIPAMTDADHSIAAVIASTNQGRKLRDNAKALFAVINSPFPKPAGKAKLVRGDGDDAVVDWDGLTVTVIHPNQQSLEEYQKKWDKDLKSYQRDGDDRIIAAALVDKDKSPFNLSSIVCLVEFRGKKILLTGDSRTDDILQGLEEKGLFDSNGILHVDILKLPHHGSIRNASEKFYKKVIADYYVISADGKYNNPDNQLLDLLAEKLEYGSLFFTNKNGVEGLKEKMESFEQRLHNMGSALQVNYRDDAKLSFVIELGNPIL